MNGLSDNMLPEHHVMKCIFHHHDAAPKKKMLGGVSFESAITGSSGKENHTASWAGEQMRKPPFSDVDMLSAGIGNGIGDSLGKESTGKTSTGRHSGENVDKTQKDTVSIIGAQNKKAEEKFAENAAVAAAAMQTPEAAAAGEIPKELPHRRIDYKKYISRLKNRMQTLLKGMEQKAGKEKRRQPKKKTVMGRKAITKEEVYEVQINTAYLLDSYNKYGERSVLGKE